MVLSEPRRKIRAVRFGRGAPVLLLLVLPELESVRRERWILAQPVLAAGAPRDGLPAESVLASPIHGRVLLVPLPCGGPGVSSSRVARALGRRRPAIRVCVAPFPERARLWC